MKIEFENDLGHNPLGLAHFTTDRSVLTVGYALGGLIVGSFTGAMIPTCVLAFGYFVNDVKYANRVTSPAPLPPGEHPRPDNTARGRANKLALLDELGDWGDGAIDVTAIDSLDDLLVLDMDGMTVNPPPSPSPIPAQPTPGRPNLSNLPVGERAKVLMRAMASDGMPIGSILKHPFVMAIGGSQSGKTSLATVLSMLRMATGASVAYASVDDDIPPVAWASVVGDPDGYVEAMAATAEILSNASKGGLVGQGWMFDEILRSAQEYGADITKLLIPCLTKGAKGGGLVVVVTHAKTCSAHNLKTGFSEAWERDRVAVEAIRAMDEHGQYHPTGRYRVSIPGEAPQDWQWPHWMTAQGCPVEWMLSQFPELGGSPARTTKVSDRPNPVAVGEAQDQSGDSEVAVSNYPEFNDYPMHRVVMKYVGNGSKDIGAIRHRLRNDRGEAKAESAVTDKVISYLVSKGYLVRDGNTLRIP